MHDMRLYSGEAFSDLGGGGGGGGGGMVSTVWEVPLSIVTLKSHLHGDSDPDPDPYCIYTEANWI